MFIAGVALLVYAYRRGKPSGNYAAVVAGEA
jgi:hypothetical protein